MRKCDLCSIGFVNAVVQGALFLAINVFFVCKYVPRAGVDPVLFSVLYVLIATGLMLFYRLKIHDRLTDKGARILSVLTLTGLVAVIAASIIFIDPMTIRVDRWSATSYFLDALFRGEYPYGVSTHLNIGNYPSPFPFWQYLNIPFWLIGDVGWIQVFFLLVFAGAIYAYFRAWKPVWIALALLCMSPAYWWEIAARSDSLSNAFLVCACLLMIEKYAVKMELCWWILAVVAGCLASTRLSAVIPVALYLFRPWLDASWQAKIGFVGLAAAIALAFFAPYICWDTENWIFFQRNPFMSQTSPGSPWILGIMMLIAIGIAYKKKTFAYFVSTTSVFLFAFMLFTQLGVIYRCPEPINLFDIRCDISYFSLSLPYIFLALTVSPTGQRDQFAFSV